MEGIDQGPQRLFLALWPELALQRRLVEIAESLPELRRGGRRVHVASVHVTLAFLGQVDASQRACIERSADDVRVAPFELALDRISCFRRRRLLWIGASQVPAPLQQLVTELKSAQGACGLVPDERNYHVHVTLARGVRRCPPDTAIEPIMWPVREFVLVRSELGAGAGRYDVVRTWPLR